MLFAEAGIIESQGVSMARASPLAHSDARNRR